MIIVLYVLLAAALAYGGLLLFVWLRADRMMFPRPRAGYGAEMPVQFVRANDGAELATLRLESPAAPCTILYLHGNAEDLGRVRPRLEALRQRGFSVVAFDYRGYGRTPGMPTEANVLSDTRDVFRYVTTVLRVPAARVIVYGRSLGSGPAVDLAANERVGGLVIEGGFTSAFRVVSRVRLVPWDRFDNLGKAARVTCPILVVHGRRDETVPFHHGPALFDAFPEPKECLWHGDAGHNDVPDIADDEYWQALGGLAKRVADAATDSELHFDGAV